MRSHRFLKLHPQAVDPPDIKSYKAFMEFYSKNTPGRLEERPTVGTVEDFRGDFEAGMSRRRKYRFPDQVSTTIREWILSWLKDKIGLSTAEMHKDGLSPNDLTVLMTQLWCKDFKEYRGEPPDRARVQLSAAMLLYCFTSARAGEVHESTARRALAREQKTNDKKLEARVLAACYKHFHLTIDSVDGRVLIVLTNQREYVKGYWRKKQWELPVHAFYDIYREDTYAITKIVRHRMAFLKPYISRRAFSRRQFTELAIEKTTEKARGADSFGKALVELGHRSGYLRNITVRASRRWVLMEADKKYSETARMKMAGHENSSTFGKSYAHPVCEIDGPATYFGITYGPTRAHTKSPWNGNHIVYNEKKRLYTEQLKSLQKSQPNRLRPTTNCESNANEETLFRYRRRVMPERDYLARILPQRIGLRSGEGRKALEALESLCTLKCSVAYCSSLQPVNGKCICGEQIEKIDSVPIADGYAFTVVKGCNFVVGASMDLQNSALSAIVGLMIVQGGNVIAKSILNGQRSCSGAIPY
ncbi:hypothetical protein V8E54_011971 [Elaphomyces granulatus]